MHTVAQLALAWLLAQGENIVPIPGTRSPKPAGENIGAADLTLSDADINRIAEILPPADSAPATPRASPPFGTYPPAPQQEDARSGTSGLAPSIRYEEALCESMEAEVSPHPVSHGGRRCARVGAVPSGGAVR
jgi:hypothetical protein